MDKINISTISHLKRRFDADEQDENLSFFAGALEKWSDLNCTQDYKDVRQNFGSTIYVQNLVQIIHRKRELVQILIDGLKVHESKAVNAILELIVALARDLQSEFYEFFHTIFELLVDLTCHASDTETLEALFVCQTFLFKYLWKFILKDIGQHFETIKKAIKSKKEYIVNFSCEVFSFLIKKSKHQEELVQLLFDGLKADATVDKGIGRILFESVKGVNNDFHSQARPFLDIVFNKFVNSQCDHYDQMMQYFVAFLLDHSNKDSFKLIWNYLLLDSSKFSTSCLCKTIPLVNQVTLYKKCKLVHDSSLVLIGLTDYLRKHQFETKNTAQLLLNSIENIFNHRNNDILLEKVYYFCDFFYSANSSTLPLEQIFAFSQNVANCSIFDIALNKYCCKLCLQVLQHQNDDNIKRCLQMLAYLVVSKRPRPVFGGENYKISKYSLQFEQSEDAKVEDILLKCLECTDLDSLIYTIIVIPHLPFLSNTNTICQSISASVMNQIGMASANITTNQLAGQLLVELVVSLALLKSQDKTHCPIDEISPERMISLVK